MSVDHNPIKIIVRNLPKTVNEEKIIDVFSDTKRYGNGAILTNVSISYDLISGFKYAILEFKSDTILKTDILDDTKYINDELNGEDIRIEVYQHPKTNNINIIESNRTVNKQDELKSSIKIPKENHEIKKKPSSELKSVPIVSDIKDDFDKEYENAIMIENVIEEDLETIEIVFSNHRNGGGPISRRQITDNQSLILFFEKQNTASSVLGRNEGIVNHNGRTYSAKKVPHTHKEPLDAESRDNKIEYEVVLKNVEEKFSETLKSLFENKGGVARSFNYDKNRKELTIEYEKMDSVNTIVSLGDIKYKDKTFRAFRKKEQFIGSLKLIVTESEKTNEKNYFDNFKLKIKILPTDSKIEFNDKERTIKSYVEANLLTHNDFEVYEYHCAVDESLSNEGVLVYLMISNLEIDYKQLNEGFDKKHSLCERRVVIERIKDTNLLVKLENDMHKDQIHNHFSVKRTSGGGEIKNIKKINKYCFIEFKDKSCVNEVLDKRRNHGAGVQVFPYFDDLAYFEKQFNSNKSYKICPLCTTDCKLSHNYCMNCNYRFKYKKIVENETVEEEVTEIKLELLGRKRCPNCTVITDINHNFCFACNHKFQKQQTIEKKDCATAAGTSTIDSMKETKSLEERCIGDIKVCPICTLHCGLNFNYCPTCNYLFNQKANTQQKEIEKKECKKCKKQSRIDHIYCTECGERYDAENNALDEQQDDKNDEKACPSCTFKNDATKNFCELCFSRLS